MDNKQINIRLQNLLREERAIRSKLDCKTLFYDKYEWTPSNNNVKLLDNEIVFEGNNVHFYISYLESNNSFNLAPNNPLFDNLNLYSYLNINFQGEIKGECDVRLFVITYVNQTQKEIISVELNSKKNIEIGNAQDIRLAIRIQGNGRFRLKSIVLDPAPETVQDWKSNGQNVHREIHVQREIKEAKKLIVAMVVDEFTYESFRHECDAIYLSPSNWRETLELNKPDFFFCESAWSGKDSDKREWKGKVYSSINFKKENRNELINILQYCKENGIKTVFWNKEDPNHYDDKVHNFVDTALKFDYIFTTAEECVERYKSEYNHDHVYPLMFAVQPKNFNPIEKYERTDDIVFAGSYYRQHPERCKVMDQIFNLIIKQNQSNLVIYDRHYYNQDENHTFPHDFLPYIKPSLPYTRIDKAYKGSKYALNINTETESNTMFARRVFELMASNTLVLSNHSKGLDKHFGDFLFLFKDDEEILNQAFNVDYYKHRLKALRYVLKYHTYEDRLTYVLDIIGINVKQQVPSVCVLMFVCNEHELLKSIEIFDSQSFREKKLLIINQGSNPIQTAQWLARYGSSSVFVTDMNMFEKYNKNIDEFIIADYIACMNFNFYYGNNYLLDILLSYKYVDKETVVVKNSNFKPYQFVNEASIYAAVFPKSALEFFDFNQLDDFFIQKLFEVGYRVFNCDPFNILYPNENNIENRMRINI